MSLSNKEGQWFNHKSYVTQEYCVRGPEGEDKLPRLIELLKPHTTDEAMVVVSDSETNLDLIARSIGFREKHQFLLFDRSINNTIDCKTIHSEQPFSLVIAVDGKWNMSIDDFRLLISRYRIPNLYSIRHCDPITSTSLVFG